GHDDMVVSGGYRSVEEQQEIYSSAEDPAATAKPGFSDYQTGYSVDFGVADEDGTVKDFTGLDDYSWFEKNCYRYGFVLRYPDGKKDYTGYDYRPWHFRYVGKAHAFYMYKNNLCLEEYIEKLKTFEYTQTHLIFSDDNGNEYETYYYPIDNTATSTILAVPDKEYELSGNNSDGYIITFLVGSAAEEETQPEAEAGQAAQTTAAGTSAATEAAKSTTTAAVTSAAPDAEKTAETTKKS
ncbi:MAG: D-alanyl-D-alanine carboxypeptidase family protein, partial [Porcipelethomonas sp.]